MAHTRYLSSFLCVVHLIKFSRDIAQHFGQHNFGNHGWLQLRNWYDPVSFSNFGVIVFFSIASILLFSKLPNDLYYFLVATFSNMRFRTLSL